jgi:hypothetical protein
MTVCEFMVEHPILTSALIVFIGAAVTELLERLDTLK